MLGMRVIIVPLNRLPNLGSPEAYLKRDVMVADPELLPMTVVKVGGEAYLRAGRNASGCILWRRSSAETIATCRIRYV